MTRPTANAVRAALVVAACLAASCANRPESISASYVSHEKYTRLACDELQARMIQTRADLERNSAIQNEKADGDAAGVFLFGIPFSKLTGDVQGEISRLKGEIEAIDTARIKNRCETRPSATVAAAPAAAHVPTPVAAPVAPARPTLPQPPTGLENAESSPVVVSEWVDVTDQAELRAIYYDTTIRGAAYVGRSPRATPFFGHYRSDGTGVLVINGRRYPRAWEVTPAGEVCTMDRSGRNCYRLQRNVLNPVEFKGKSVTTGSSMSFSVVEGYTPPGARPVAAQPIATPVAAAPAAHRVPAPEPVVRAPAVAPPPPAPAVATQAQPNALPKSGTTWVYGFEDRGFNRRKSVVTVRVIRSNDFMVEEVLTLGERNANAAVRIVTAREPCFLEYALDQDAALIELAPYLLVANEGAGLPDKLGLSGYPAGGSGLPPWQITARKGRWEEISVPAGRFRAFRVDVKGKRRNEVFGHGQQTGSFEVIAWYAPAVKRLVKIEHKTWSTGPNVEQSGHDAVELLSYLPPS